MRILGIETSCDETAASVVEDGRWVHSNIVSSSLKQHQKYGGIIPEIAARRQLEYIHGVVEEALAKAAVTLAQIDAIAVTQSPGLVGSLLVGISFARALAFGLKKPLIEVDHIHAHLYANFLANASSKDTTTASAIPTLPAMGLVVSGGHSNLFYIRATHHYQLLGQTRDDAVGEAFDKVAKILELGYPGGPIIDRLANQGKAGKIKFPCASLPNSFDFSFSGIKTAVLYYHREHRLQPDFAVSDVARAFQTSVTNVLVEKCLWACRKKKVSTLLVGGGVSANSELRQKLETMGNAEGIKVYCPPLPLCLDNAAMIAGLGYPIFKNPPPDKQEPLPRLVKRHFSPN